MYTLNPYETKPSTNSRYRLQLKTLMRNVIVNDLTERQRQVISMHYEGKKVTQIATELNLNKSTVSRTLKAAMKKFEKNKKIFENVVV
jgi:RNA polymerase sigma factor (sigma-70 family)